MKNAIGLHPIKINGFRDFDATGISCGHAGYRKHMYEILVKAGVLL